MAARFAKNRKTKVQPLPADVAAALRDYLDGKPANAPVWGGTWASGCTGAEMLRRDLEAVGIAYAVEGPDGPEYADFHSLRHTYLTMLGRNGVDLRTLKNWPGIRRRCSPPATRTAGCTTWPGPWTSCRTSCRRPGRTRRKSPFALTGTEGAKEYGACPSYAVVPGVVTGGAGRHQSAPKYTFGDIGGGKVESTQPLETQGAGAFQHRPASNGIKLPGQDSNLDKESQNLLCCRYTTG